MLFTEMIELNAFNRLGKPVNGNNNNTSLKINSGMFQTITCRIEILFIETCLLKQRINWQIAGLPT